MKTLNYLFFPPFYSLLGVPIAYDNIRVVGELGDIYDDQGHIHLNIEADFVIFCPKPGQKLMVCTAFFFFFFSFKRGPKGYCSEAQPTAQWVYLKV